jgi:hypothetical protein
MASVRKRNRIIGRRGKDCLDRRLSRPVGDAPYQNLQAEKGRERLAGRTTLGEVERGVHTPPSSSITVAEAGEAWIALAEIDGLERPTLEQYRQHLQGHIRPLLGRATLAKSPRPW